MCIYIGAVSGYTRIRPSAKPILRLDAVATAHPLGSQSDGLRPRTEHNGVRQAGCGRQRNARTRAGMQMCAASSLHCRGVPRVAKVLLEWVVYVVHMIGCTRVCFGHEVADRHLPYEQGLSMHSVRTHARSRLLFNLIKSCYNNS